MKNLVAISFCLIILSSCEDDPSKPTDTGYATVQVQEQQEMECPYCMGYGIQNSYYGTVQCSYCQGKGKRYNVVFRAQKVKTLKKADRYCPVGSCTFECVDDKNNNVISTTDKCINCGHMYFDHRKSSEIDEE